MRRGFPLRDNPKRARSATRVGRHLPRLEVENQP